MPDTPPTAHFPACKITVMSTETSVTFRHGEPSMNQTRGHLASSVALVALLLAPSVCAQSASQKNEPQDQNPAPQPEPARDQTSQPRPARDPEPAPAREAHEERPLPKYDGREQHTTTGEVALWVPRVLFFPLYVVSEYVIRRPLGFAITATERYRVPTLLYDFFTFGPEHQAGIVPIALVDLGFRPHVGLYGFWNGAGVKMNDVRLAVSYGGSDWLSFGLTDRWHLSKYFELGVAGNFVKRPDYSFYGIGRDTREDARSRYGANTANARLVLRVHAVSSYLETSAGYRHVSFFEGGFGGDPTLEGSSKQGLFALPDGYAGGYEAPVIGATGVLDSRAKQARSQTGARIEGTLEEGADLSRSHGAGWIRYGGTAGVFWDVADTGRVFSLSVSTELVDALRSRHVPFTELSTLGGAAEMPGFRAGRLRDRSSAEATLRYMWPIWVWLNGSMQASVGNVFDKHLRNFSVNDSRFSGALGIETSSSRDSVFQALIGFGTETFDSGAHLNALRFVVGARHGF